MANEEGRSDVSDVENIGALSCFAISRFENYLRSQHFNSGNIKEGWNKRYRTSHMERSSSFSKRPS